MSKVTYSSSTRATDNHEDKPLAWLHGEIRSAGSASSGTTMLKSKRKRLEAKGWRFGSSRKFLRLSGEEEAFIEVKLGLSRCLRERRLRERISQADFAARIQSSQSRVAKMEAGDPSVSIDLLVRSLLALGVSCEEVADSIRRAA